MRRYFMMIVTVTGLLAGGLEARAAGAIAVDDEAGVKVEDVGYGIGSGSSREEAAAEAKKQCKKAGNSDCKVVVRYDTCGAYAASKDYTGVGWGESEKEAKTNALEACGSGCKIVVADCQ